MFGKLWQLLKSASLDWIDDECSRWGAVLAFYSMMSLAPLLVIAVAIAGTVYGEAAAQGALVGRMQELAGQNGAEVIEQILANAHRPGLGSLAALLSVGVLLFAAGSVFTELRAALNHIWEVAPPATGTVWQFVKGKLLGLAMVLVTGTMLLSTLALSTLAQVARGDLANWWPGLVAAGPWSDMLISFVLLTGLFALVYRYLSDVRVAWRDVWVGALITAILFSIGKSLLGVYLGRSSWASAYGAAGSFVLLIVWIYYSAQILLFGAELTQVYSRQFSSGLRRRRTSKRTSPNSQPTGTDHGPTQAI
ncbi:MAG: YihY/virulence factor BrkB family protein [Pirellulales bacterium]|nr:YihY/virulence factor BrkB family protein [Pirellulales bacterium]